MDRSFCKMVGKGFLSVWFAGGAVLLCLPLVALVYKALSAPSPIFEHLQQTVLWDYVRNSVVLVLGVGGLSLLWGVPSAWLMARYRFWGRGFFRWALLLPLAIPSYLSAFVYTNLFDYAGWVQSALRAWFGFQSAQDYWFFKIRSMGGAIFVLSLSFAPYVYWLMVQRFSRLPASQIQAAEILGAKRFEIFYRVILPLSRPSLVVALALVSMETLADFGTAAYFSVWHLTTGIYDVWLSHGDLSAAAKLSVLMLVMVVGLLMLERHQRRHQSLTLRQTDTLSPKRFERKTAEIMAISWFGLLFLLGFVVPAGWLLQAAWVYLGDTDWAAFLKMIRYSLQISLWVALWGAMMAFGLLSWIRIRGRGIIWVRLSSLGYAVPGTVLAIGVLMVTTAFDHQLNAFTQKWGMGIVGLVWSGSVAVLVYAFWCRFSAVGLGAVESGFSGVSKHLDQSALLLGCSESALGWRLWLPLLRNSLLTAGLLLFLESMKELSAAMLLRPFHVQTLSTYIYDYMSAERFEMAALPAVVMVVVGLPMVFFLLRAMED